MDGQTYGVKLFPIFEGFFPHIGNNYLCVHRFCSSIFKDLFVAISLCAKVQQHGCLFVNVILNVAHGGSLDVYTQVLLPREWEDFITHHVEMHPLIYNCCHGNKTHLTCFQKKTKPNMMSDFGTSEDK
jgi:hypothetical protein